MDNRRNNKGTPGNAGGGRKPKAYEQNLLERLSPLTDEAFKTLRAAIKDNQPWAVKLFFAYNYGQPTQILQADITQSHDSTFIERLMSIDDSVFDEALNNETK